MVDRALLEQLRSNDAGKRKAAIQQLARSKDLTAIPHLEAFEKKELDASVADLARKAVIYIKRHAEDDQRADLEAKRVASDHPQSIMSEYGGGTRTSTEELSDKPVEVSASKAQRAQLSLRAALDNNMRDDNAKAVKHLIDAFKLNPGLAKDAYARGLAATITGLHVPEAVAAVVDGSAIELFTETTKQKRDAANNPAPNIGWGDSIVDLLLYGVVNAVVLGVSLFLIIYVLIASLPPAALNPANFAASGAVSPVNVAQLIDQLALAGTIMLIIYSALYGLMQIIGLLIQASLIHLAATMMLGGDGTLPTLIRKLTTLLIIGTPILLIVQVAIFYFSLESPQVSIASGPILLVATLLFLFLYIGRIASTYQFSWGKGCLSVLISSVILTIVGCGIGYLMVTALGSSLQSLIVVTP